MNRYMKQAEACEYLQISRVSLLNMEKQGLIRPTKTKGGHRRYLKEDLDAGMMVKRANKGENKEKNCINRFVAEPNLFIPSIYHSNLIDILTDAANFYKDRVDELRKSIDSLKTAALNESERKLADSLICGHENSIMELKRKEDITRMILNSIDGIIKEI